VAESQDGLLPPSPVSQNGITNQGVDGGFSQFINPGFVRYGEVQAPIELFGVVPEPSTLLLLTAGTIGLLWAKRRVA
jgi:PEP-CTERM motif